MSENSSLTPFGWEREKGLQARALFLIAVAFSAYQIVIAAYHPLSSQVVRAIHVGFLLLMTFASFPVWLPRRRSVPSLAWLIGATGFVLAFYHWIYEGDLIQRAGDPTQTDLVVGTITLIMVFEGARRMMGAALPLICATFLAYAAFGQYLPGDLAHRGYDFSQLIEHLTFGTEGIYGVPTYVSSTYIFLFILFGAFLEQAGMIQLFTNFALGTVGHTRGGPAKVSVISSGLMGTINGSGVANVVTTGQFTIPLMKRFGYRPEFAGGVEATSSMGGQIMPPVMGAVAFIMAETIGVAYVEIVTAAIIPAVLYFVTAFWMVHLEAGRAGLHGLAKSECPNAWEAIRRGWYLLLPLGILVWLLFSGYTPLFSGTVGLALTAVLIFGAAIALRLKGNALRVAFWIALGIACSGFLKWGIDAFFVLIALLVLVCAFIHGGRETLRLAVNALADGARHALPVGVACALVGVIIGVLTLTGAATSFANMIITLGENNMLLSLVLTMLVCLLLGMGIPTIPNYIITSSLAAPALLELGVPLIVSHMFVFYFGILADLTPPVALAAFAAAPIAGVSGMKIGVQAVRIAMAGFIIPYMAVYAPELMLQGDPTVLAVVWIVFKAVLAIGLWGVASVGYLWQPVSWPERVGALLAAICLVAALPITDEIGIGAAALLLGLQIWRRRQLAH
ncbi:MAG: C4-dicarboxylate ABC transporter [Azoarcus sp.]|uniref:C4-dicarboxylate ABC transporter n=1 Tax=Parazoarcus communis TaxID=41977 RepID=A0A2U8GTU1_9RHOO|nr:TRAP transporter permease [Parazoarcus communis]AWI76820.1 C4-dicarboxylate ABC transporter [Parazoarcus communis]PLX77226.1 MAG: C4-dicarboxylate ABC transporter [Azoarcus sp.]|tara:strand:+ start:174384 stop:176420 length:2037 start_codon:yes stop_codon:yes gene_type:complete